MSALTTLPAATKKVLVDPHPFWGGWVVAIIAGVIFLIAGLWLVGFAIGLRAMDFIDALHWGKSLRAPAAPRAKAAPAREKSPAKATTRPSAGWTRLAPPPPCCGPASGRSHG